jgi:hypothetical protein
MDKALSWWNHFRWTVKDSWKRLQPILAKDWKEIVKSYLVPVILSLIVTYLLAGEYFHDIGIVLVIVLWLIIVVFLRFLGNLFTAPSKVFHEQQAIINKYRRQAVISERTIKLILSTPSSEHMAPGEVVQYIALNSENPHLTSRMIEEDLETKASRGEIEISAIPQTSLERQQLPREILEFCGLRIMPWKDRFKRVWPYDAEVDRVGGQLYRKDNPSDILGEGLQFVRSQIESVYPPLTIAGRKKRREMLAICPACITQEDAQNYVAKYEIDVPYTNMPRHYLVNAVLEGKISAWEKESGLGIAVEVSENRMKEVIAMLNSFVTTQTIPSLWFCMKQLQDVWFD